MKTTTVCEISHYLFVESALEKTFLSESLPPPKKKKKVHHQKKRQILNLPKLHIVKNGYLPPPPRPLFLNSSLAPKGFCKWRTFSNYLYPSETRNFFANDKCYTLIITNIHKLSTFWNQKTNPSLVFVRNILGTVSQWPIKYKLNCALKEAKKLKMSHQITFEN